MIVEYWNLAWSTWSQSTTSQVVTIVLGLIVVLLVDTLYSLYLSPLSAFPGPRICAISRLPHLIATIEGKQLPWQVDLHEKYGGIVRVAPDALTVVDERGWADILGSTKAAKHGMAKDPRLAALVGDDLVNPDPAKPQAIQTHSLMRRVMVPAFKGENVKRLGTMISGHIDEYLAAIGRFSDTDTASKPVDMRDANGFLICNMMADVCFGESLHLFSDDTYVPWAHSFDRFSKAVTILAVLNRVSFLHKLILFAVRRWGGKERDSFTQPILSRFERRIAAGTRREDLLQMVLDDESGPNGSGKGRKMPLDLLRLFAPFLMLGGCETMPTTLTGFVYFVYCRNNADARKRLLSEIRGAFNSKEDITMERVAHTAKEFPYFEAFLQETFRCYSPAVSGADRVVPAGGAQIAGRWVPGGTVVTMLHQATYMVTQNFARPYEFIPERWLDADAGRPVEFNDDKRQAVRPFSIGPQGCFGQEVSFYVLRLTLFKLLYAYDLELTPECEDWLAGQSTYTTRAKPPLMAYAKLVHH
ncbi:cytochrome P450 [Trichoderma velutinum]